MASEDGLDALLDVVRSIQSDLAVAGTRAARELSPETDLATTSSSPTVFISWAHAHASWTTKQIAAWEASIATLASTLRQSFGIDADVDLFHLHERTDWTRYGQRAIVDNERTIVVLSKAWAERWDGTNSPMEGAGAAREADALHGLFSRNQQEWQEKLIIVVLPDVDLTDLPPDLDRVARTELDPSDLDSYEGLVRLLTGQPQYLKPALGTVPELPPLHSGRNLAALRAQLVDVLAAKRIAAKEKSPARHLALQRLSQQESALRGFIETALRSDD